MSSRQEEKERRRREREEREQAEARKASARRRLQLVAGAVLGIAAIAAVAVAVLAGGGSSDGGPAAASDITVAIPAQKIADLNAAAKAAKCEVKTFPSEGRTHLDSDSASFSGYKTNPPTSGTHRPTPAEDGIYAAGNEPDPENWVHTLEHGRILIQYKPGTAKTVQDQLETLFNEKLRGVAGYHQVLMQNNTNMPFAVAAVAWTHHLGCPAMNDQVFDAIRAFRERFVDKGPELIP
jgi:hypothetical protein